MPAKCSGPLKEHTLRLEQESLPSRGGGGATNPIHERHNAKPNDRWEAVTGSRGAQSPDRGKLPNRMVRFVNDCFGRV